MVGKNVLHYRILEKLGGGGMGVVYKAHDTKLGRHVALKFLPGEVSRDLPALKRFQREARAASALNHPNICTIHDVDQDQGLHFIVMELLEGQTLDQLISGRPIRTGDVFEWGTQIADALEAAHAHGIIHRDIKPANIIITPRGQVKILDFGLAKLAVQERVAGETVKYFGLPQPPAKERLTGSGSTLGTVGYMSPEQVRGEELDARTDLFSLGVVLYEMTTGRRAFPGNTSGVIFEAILNRMPSPLLQLNPETSPDLVRIINKALEKDRVLRYQTAADVRADLQRAKRDSDPQRASVSTAIPAPASAHRPALWRRKAILGLAAIALLVLLLLGGWSLLLRWRSDDLGSVAILPFVNASGDPGAEYLSDALTESLINSVSQLPNLRVVPGMSSFRYKGKEVDPRIVGRELGVHAVVTGRVVLHGDSLAVSVELVDAEHDKHLWGMQYNDKLTDLLTIQREMSLKIAEKLQRKLQGKEQKDFTNNNEAYRLYQQGRYYLQRRTRGELGKAINCFQGAIANDPQYALAYSGLADSYSLAEYYRVLSTKDAAPRAKAAVAKALALDGSLGEAHASLAYIKRSLDWDWAGAEQEFKLAIKLKPDYVTAHHWYGMYWVALKRQDNAIEELRRALDIEPFSLSTNLDLGRVLYYGREYDQAIKQLQDTLAFAGNSPVAHLWLGRAYLQKAMYPEGLAQIGKAVALSGETPDMLAALGHAYALTGRRPRAQEILKQLQKLQGPPSQRYVSPYDFATVYLGLRQTNQVFASLDQAYAQHAINLVYLSVEPLFDPLRPDPRFQNLLKRMKLPP